MATPIDAVHAFIQGVTRYAFHNSSLLEEALDTTGLRSTDSNERLPMIGKSRLKNIVLDDWYPTGATKGSGDQLVSAIGGQPNLALVARQIGLDREFAVLNPEHVGEATDNTLATTVEAILGAIYWDSKNEQAVRRAMIQMGLFAKCYAVGREGPRIESIYRTQENY